MKWVLVIAGLLVVLVAAAVIALLVMVREEVKKVSADPIAFAAIEIGMTQADVETIIGDTDKNFEVDGAGDPPQGASCLFYLNKDDKQIAYRLCYADGKLVDKKEFRVGG